ncbi:HDOD domain-containing protein [Noviherbaspirillum sp. CPCC 100848]|uniref:HDOD domain-containing protein n=1 Tax=Noviherbaspirillum album TaxID=3080276 RepID=A0ABU6J7H1_9BURK|nr:HDOD domain-containing protein [Noviherbaspirillum sp. CPCC 100848]MEC4719585.1 HDOD domain-containing protein [Noviherbaspirillum sp. CPCC 100848]
MTTTHAPLFTIELLADRRRNLAGLIVHAGADGGAQPERLPAHEDLSEVAARISCFFIPGTTLQDDLLAAGLAPLDQGAVHHSDQLAPLTPHPQARYLSGNWYLAPPAKPTGAQAASRALALQLVQLVTADADTHEIEAVLRRDPALSYHLLRLVNSLGMGMSRQITSFAQAILILGRAQLRRWLNLMLFSSRSNDERSAMLLARVAVRARAMELTAKAAGMDKSAQELAFMTGMFSLLGILFGMPLAEVLKPLKVSAELLNAVLEYEGDLGQLLRLVECIERKETSTAAALLAQLHVPADEYNRLLIEAHRWMLDVIQESRGGGHA